jgi:hypothetical protein
MKKLVKKISNSFLSDWRGMSIVRKILFVAMMTSSISLIVSNVFFHQFVDFLFVVTLSILTIYLLYIVGGVFVAIFKEMIKTFPEEWRKMKKIEKILFVGFLTGSAIILPAVFLKLKAVAFLDLVLMSACVIYIISDYIQKKIIAKNKRSE